MVTLVTGGWPQVHVSVLIISLSISMAYGRFVGGAEVWYPVRRSQLCGWQGESCYSTDQCCKPFVCAAFDEMGTNIDIPGICMREKDLKACDSDRDCRTVERCARLDGIASAYCVPRPRPSPSSTHHRVVSSSSGGGGLGASCVTSLDCRAYTETGTDRLCCQKVHLGRQGSKVMCDKVTARSVCIAS